MFFFDNRYICCMARKKISKYRKKVDWAAIEPEWAAGQLSKSEIGRQHDVSVPAMNKHFDKEGLVYGSLSGSIRRKIEAKLIENPDKVKGQVQGAEPRAAVEKAAERGADVVRLQRKDIAVLKALEDKFLNELGDDPTKLYITQYQGEIVQAETGIAVTERITALRNLTAARAQRIALERQAYSLDEERTDTGNSVADAIREREKGR